MRHNLQLSVEFTVFEGTKLHVMEALNALMICVFIVLFALTILNVFKILIIQRLFKLVPLSIFYFCAIIVQISRITQYTTCLIWYLNGQQQNGKNRILYQQFALVANFVNAIIGIFQVASLVELTIIMFKMPNDKYAAQQQSNPSFTEKESDSRGIFVTYLLSVLLSFGVLGFLVFLEFKLFPVVTDQNIIYYETSLILVYSLLSLALTTITILLVIYTSRMPRKSLSRESRLLCIFFIVFSVAYLSRIEVYSYNAFVDNHTFAITLTETAMPSIWEVLPIAILL